MQKKNNNNNNNKIENKISNKTMKHNTREYIYNIAENEKGTNNKIK